MADRDNMVQKTYRLPAGDVEMIERLASNKIMGANPSAVLRAILSSALKELVQTEFVKKHMEAMELLSKK